MSKEPKDWKESLQRSGFSLENRIDRKLDDLKITHQSHVEFERIDRDGKVSIHSHDFAGEVSLGDVSNQDPKDLYFRFVIECKQRHEGVKWFFQPVHNKNKTRDCEIILGYNWNAPLMSGWQAENEDHLGCNGIETGENINESGVKHALCQVAYSIPIHLLAISDLMDKAKKTGWGGETISFLIPIVVTTAPLYLLDSDWDEKHRGAKDPTDIGKEMQFIVNIEDPTIDLRDHRLWVLNKKRGSLRLERGSGSELGINPFINDYLSGGWKSLVYCIFVRDIYFPQLITDYMEKYRKWFGVFTKSHPD